MGHTHIEYLLTSEPQIENLVRELQSANLNLLWRDSANFSSSQFDSFLLLQIYRFCLNDWSRFKRIFSLQFDGKTMYYRVRIKRLREYIK